MRWFRHLLTVSAFAIVAGIAVGATLATRDFWLPWLTAQPPAPAVKPGEDGSGGHDHAGDHHADHDHAADGGHGADGEQNSLRLSEQARANLGLKLGAVELSEYKRSVVISGVVVEQPGHCERRVTTTLPGVVTKVHAFPGQTVRPGDPLLNLQPTGDLLAAAQSALLKTIQDEELIGLELQRISPLVESGSIPARSRIEKEYEQRRLTALKLVQMQELLVRGLSAEQIAEIVAHKTLLREFTIYVPGPRPPFNSADHGHEHPAVVPAGLLEGSPADDEGHEGVVYTVERVGIFPGSLVQPGAELCDLAEHTELYLEGHAFERDDGVVTAVLQQSERITALFDLGPIQPLIREGLQIRYIDNMLDPVTRTLRFFVPLKNEVVRDAMADNGVIYRSWRFKPGQKVRLLLPVQRLSEQIVLPAEAVVSEGPDAYVFRANGQLLEQVPVIVEHRDPRSVVIRNDGSVFPGDEIAMNQAYQIHLALQKQKGSGVDMHAGHSH